MTSSSAWDDINPTARPTTANAPTLRAVATRIRHLTTFAAQLVEEGQIDRAQNYLQQAIEVTKEVQ
jgi:RNase P subunit RPR2